MTRILFGVIGSSLFLFSLAAGAETLGTIPFYSHDEYQLTHSMFDKVRADLYQAQTNQAHTNAYAGNAGDNFRFDTARAELNRLEQNWDRAEFDSSEIAATISTLETIENDNRLKPQDRDVLDADISRLLDFRTDYY